eukprot:265494-Prorocentrum_minimum.AAC.1
MMPLALATQKAPAPVAAKFSIGSFFDRQRSLSQAASTPNVDPGVTPSTSNSKAASQDAPLRSSSEANARANVQSTSANVPSKSADALKTRGGGISKRGPANHKAVVSSRAAHSANEDGEL